MVKGSWFQDDPIFQPRLSFKQLCPPHILLTEVHIPTCPYLDPLTDFSLLFLQSSSDWSLLPLFTLSLLFSKSSSVLLRLRFLPSSSFSWSTLFLSQSLSRLRPSSSTPSLPTTPGSSPPSASFFISSFVPKVTLRVLGLLCGHVTPSKAILVSLA